MAEKGNIGFERGGMMADENKGRLRVNSQKGLVYASRRRSDVYAF